MYFLRTLIWLNPRWCCNNSLSFSHSDHFLFPPEILSHFFFLDQCFPKELSVLPNKVYTLCNPMDCSLPGSSVQMISQTRVLEWVAISFSRGSSQPRDGTCVSCFGRQILYHWATGYAQHTNCSGLKTKSLVPYCSSWWWPWDTFLFPQKAEWGSGGWEMAELSSPWVAGHPNTQ